MKFYNIPPTKHLPLMHHGDSYFALAHFCLSNPEYKEFFVRLSEGKEGINNRYNFITLDNGAAEHSLVSEDALIELVDEICPDEVIAPDVLFDKEKTLDNFYSFLHKMSRVGTEYCLDGLLGNTDIFACPQGSNKQEWLDCYKEMLDNPYVKVIGLSKIAVPKCWNDVTGDKLIGESRNRCVAELMERGWIKKPLHLLGMGEHTEFDFYLKNKIPNIRSSDSCYTVLAALNGIDFRSGDVTRIPTTNDFFNVHLTPPEQFLAIANIEYLKRKYAEV